MLLYATETGERHLAHMQTLPITTDIVHIYEWGKLICKLVFLILTTQEKRLLQAYNRLLSPSLVIFVGLL